MSNGDFWTSAQWQTFNGNPTARPPAVGLLGTTMRPMQVAQQVFPTIVVGNDNPIPADIVEDTGIPTTGVMRPFATLRKPFKLAPVQIQDSALTMAVHQVNFAAQALAVAEDMLFFRGNEAPLPKDGLHRVELGAGDQGKLGDGLLGVAHTNSTLDVDPYRPGCYGMRSFDTVVKGITQFTAHLQGPPYALILAPKIFADVNRSLPDNPSTSPANSILSVLASGPLLMSAGMRPDTGLLVSLGGKTTTLYIGTAPLVEFNTYANSIYSFSARESIQFFNFDKRSLIYLHFRP